MYKRNRISDGTALSICGSSFCIVSTYIAVDYHICVVLEYRACVCVALHWEWPQGWDLKWIMLSRESPCKCVCACMCVLLVSNNWFALWLYLTGLSKIFCFKCWMFFLFMVYFTTLSVSRTVNTFYFLGLCLKGLRKISESLRIISVYVQTAWQPYQSAWSLKVLMETVHVPFSLKNLWQLSLLVLIRLTYLRVHMLK